MERLSASNAAAPLGVSAAPHAGPLDLLVIIGPQIASTNLLIVIEDARKQGLSVTVVGDGKSDVRLDSLPAAIPAHAHIYVSVHGLKDPPEGAPKNHKMRLEAGKPMSDSVDFVRSLRSRFPDWKGMLHLSSCYGGQMRRQLNPKEMKELGPSLIYSSAKHPLEYDGEGTFAELSRYLCICKQQGKPPSDVEVFACVQAEAEQCLTGFGDSFEGLLVAHSPKTFLAATPQGFRDLIVAALNPKPLCERHARIQSEAHGKPQIAGAHGILSRLLSAVDDLISHRDPGGSSDNRARGGLRNLIAADKVAEVLQWLEAEAGLPSWKGHFSTPLHYAARKAAASEILNGLLDAGVLLEACDSSGATALHLSCVGRPDEQNDRLRAATVLLNRGANVEAQTKRGRTALHCAAAVGYVGLVRLLFERGASCDARDKDGLTPLHLAGMSELSDRLVIDAIMANGGDVDAQANDGRTPLHVAVARENRAFLEHILTYKPNLEIVDCDGVTPLHLACRRRPSADDAKADDVRMLVGAGASLQSRTPSGNAPLHLAIAAGNVAAVAALLQGGAASRALNGRNLAPIHLACSLDACEPHVRTEIVALLLEKGARVDEPDSRGSAPIHLAVERNDLALVNLLAESGAATNVENRRGDSPLQLALDNDYDAIAAFLQGRAGGTPEGPERMRPSTSSSSGEASHQTESSAEGEESDSENSRLN